MRRDFIGPDEIGDSLSCPGRFTIVGFCFAGLSRLQLVTETLSFGLTIRAGDDAEVLALWFTAEPGLYFSRVIARRFLMTGALYLMRASNRSFAKFVAGLIGIRVILSLHQAT